MSFSIQEILNKRYYIETRAKTTASGIRPLKVHGIDKKLDPNLKTAKQSIPQVVPQGHQSQVPDQSLYLDSYKNRCRKRWNKEKYLAEIFILYPT